MIPQVALNIVNQVKEKYTYDEAHSAFQAWRGKVGIDLDREENDMLYCQIIDFDFNKEWNNDNWQGEFIKGWNIDTYICNITNQIEDCKFQPQYKAVQKYFDTQIKQNWTNEGDNLIDGKFYNYDTSYDNNGNCTYIINPQMLQYKLEEYQYKLSTAKKKKDKEHIQLAIEATEKNIQMIKNVSKEYSDYWTTWDRWTNMYWKDSTDFANLWVETLKELKDGNQESEPQMEVVQEIESPEENVPEINLDDLYNLGDDSANVFSASQDNTFQSISNSSDDSDNDVSVNSTHTRIYEYKATTIELDEMSIPVMDNIDSNSDIDPSTNQHVDAEGNNTNESSYQTEGNLSPNKALSIGFTYPLLRINDHYYTDSDIKYFALETVGFIPTIEVILECVYNDILKTNMIKDGDLCSVFINPGHGSVKSYRGDFQITTVKVPKMNQFKVYETVKIKFLGELFIPSIYDSTQSFSFAGSSRDALIDAADKLGLGFFFSDPENTEDNQMWYSMADGEQKDGNDSPAIEYIKNTAKHAYKNFQSFYDCWIDPRYAISFINIAQMLGGAGLDEEIDMVFYNNTLTAGRNIDNTNRESTDEEKANNPKPQAKLLTNVGDNDNALTAFLVTGYAENNDSTITNRLGLSNANYYSIKNTGIQKVEDNSVEMNFSIPVNADKLKHGFYIMAGPGQNLTYTQADNGSFVDQHKSVQGGQIAESQSDDDYKDILESGNNMLASGNTNKFYETAEGHNLLCNSWLKKKTLSITLNGCNLQMMRGEKIPMLLQDKFNPMTRYVQANDDATFAYQKIMIQGTGWFIIQNIKWIYDREHLQRGTQWRTELTLTRREWPIPDYVKDQGQLKDAEKTVEKLYINNDVNTGSVKESTSTQIDQTNTNNAQNAQNDELTTNGLQPFMITIYNDIKEACAAGGAKIKLVSGRRWFVDEDDNKVDVPTVQDGTLWKFVNANGNIVWYSSKTSPHNTGEAIDIINDSGTEFNIVAQYIIADNKTLYDMITNGVYLGLETSKDDNGNTVKHYHIGKTDKSNSGTLTAQKNWWEKVVANYKQSITYNNQIVQVAQYLKYSNK